MCIRDRAYKALDGFEPWYFMTVANSLGLAGATQIKAPLGLPEEPIQVAFTCLLYTSDAADERSSVDLGGRRIIKKKKNEKQRRDSIFTKRDDNYIITYHTRLYSCTDEHRAIHYQQSVIQRKDER